MKTTKILVQKSETGLSEDNKAKLKSLKIYKDKKHFKFSNGWVDLAYELGKNIEEVCKLANWPPLHKGTKCDIRFKSSLNSARLNLLNPYK